MSTTALFNTLLIGVLLMCTAHCGSTSDSADKVDERTGVAAQAVSNGEAASTDEYPYVVYVEIPGGGMASGVLITPTWVLTASHAVRGSTDWPHCFEWAEGFEYVDHTDETFDISFAENVQGGG